MGEAGGDPELLAVRGAELDGGPFAIGRGARADVDGDVPGGAADDADQLALGVRVDLVVQAAQHVPAADRVVVLHEVDVEAGGLAEAAQVEALEEGATLVFEHARLEHQQPIDLEAGDLHQRPSASVVSR